jgi:deazaflavin-dependent oxidoreductase (nitroreductase family)
MIDHLRLLVADVARSRAFYDRALAPLGYRVMLEPAPGVVGMGAERPDFWLALHPEATTIVHVAFRAETTGQVDAFHAAAIGAGGRDNGAPGLRPQYHPRYYGAFVLDPDGNNVEAVCHGAGERVEDPPADVTAGRKVDASFEDSGTVRRAIRRVAASGPAARVFAPVLHRLDRPVYRFTRGRATLGSLVSGLPVGMLTTTGARSGRPRTVPLLVVPSSEGPAVIASHWGRTGPPAWERNLRADPAVSLDLLGTTVSVRAVEAQGERRARIWREALELYPGYAAYERRASGRPIGVYVLVEEGER